jgi:hypothetical protein
MADPIVDVGRKVTGKGLANVRIIELISREPLDV